MRRAAHVAWRRPLLRQAYARSDHAYQARTWRRSSRHGLDARGRAEPHAGLVVICVFSGPAGLAGQADIVVAAARGSLHAGGVAGEVARVSEGVRGRAGRLFELSYRLIREWPHSWAGGSTRRSVSGAGFLERMSGGWLEADLVAEDFQLGGEAAGVVAGGSECALTRRSERPFRPEAETAQPPVGTLSTEASKICLIEASNCAWNCSLVCWSDRSSSSAREKLAIMLGSLASNAHASSRL